MLPKINSAHGSDTRNIINRAIEVLNRLGIDVQTLVAEGQLTPEEYANLITIINGMVAKGEISVDDIDKNKGKFDQTYLTEELLQQIAGTAEINAVPADGSLTTIKYADGSVTSDKIAMPHGRVSGRELSFDVNFNNQTITINYAQVIVGNDRHYINNKEYYFGGITNSVIVVLYNPDSWDLEFSIPPNLANYNSRVVFLGILRQDDNTVSLDGNYRINGEKELKFTQSDLNVINSKADNGIVTNHAYIVGSEEAFKVDLKAEKIIINGGRTFLLNGGIRYYFSGGEYDFSEITNATILIAYNPDDASLYFVNINDYHGAGNNYILVGVIRDKQEVYVNGLHSVVQKNGNNSDSGGDSDGSGKSFYITQESVGEYLPNSPYMDDTDTVMHTAVYDVYDGLVTDYPDYVTRTLLGMDDFENNIYRYDFNPPKPKGAYEYTFPRFYYQSGIHGHEKSAAMSGALFFKELCERWKDNDALKMLRWNVAFTVIPMVNPSGFDLNTRKNGNLVDLNRNWTDAWNWQNITDVNDDHYPGTAPLSEKETQYVKSVWDTQDDIIFMFDHHNSGPTPATSVEHYVFWLGTQNENLQKIATGLGQQTSSYAKEAFPYVYQGNESLSLVSGTNASTTNREWENVYGGKGFLFETTRIMNNNPEDTQKLLMYAIGNSFVGVIKNYHHL